MYINVAICSDDNLVCSEIEDLLKNIFNGLEINFDIDIFNSGESLCDEMRKTYYDIIFLDIILPGMNGIDTASNIRESLKNITVQIVFISEEEKCALKLFEYMPIDFLIKPLNSIMVTKVIKRFLKIYKLKNEIFTYKKRYYLYAES